LNGCHIIVAIKDVVNLIIEELRKHNFSPERIGIVEKKGQGSVSFATDISQFVASKVKIARLMEIVKQETDNASSLSSSSSAPPSPPSPPAPPAVPTSPAPDLSSGHASVS